MNAKDGGPAFPVQQVVPPPAHGLLIREMSGMTLRDYFAARAMEHFSARNRARKLVIPVDEIAKQSYELADAMIAAREAT